MDDCSFFDFMYTKQSDIKESIDFVAAKLLELEKEIDKLPCSLNEVYYVALAEEMKKQINYVRSTEFLLAFLRAEDFDAVKAATRLSKFLRYKMDLFGVEKLPHRICTNDLNDDEMKIVNSGFFKYCGSDCGGRSVLIFQRARLIAFGLMNSRYIKNISRAAFYQLMCNIEDNALCQKNGCVGIRWDCNCTTSLNQHRILTLSVGKMAYEAMPLKVTAFHFCTDDNVVQAVIGVASSIMPKAIFRKVRENVNFHSGSAADCLSSLSTFGINIDFLPITMSGEYKEEPITQIPVEPLKKMNAIVSKIDDINESWINGPTLIGSEIDNNINQIWIERSSEAPKIAKHGNDSPPTIATNRNDKFPLALRKVLDDYSSINVIWWVCDGKAIAIKNNNFLCRFLEKHFKGIKVTSFFRALERWGFQRLRNAQVAKKHIYVYQHPLFQENLPLLLDRFKCIDDLSQTTTPKLKFMQKLHNILENKQSQHAIWWLEKENNTFAFHKTNFSLDVLPKNYRGIKYLSFRRSMQRWGFKQVRADGEILVFTHATFGKKWLDSLTATLER